MVIQQNPRYAILSDINSNLEALKEVLFDIQKEKISKIICLGDVLGYGPNPLECLDLIKKIAMYTYLGEWIY